jgi:hypothetical protein
VKNVTSGFAKSGICPLNRFIFPDHLFLPSQVSENEIEGDEQNDSNSAPEVGLSGVNVN